MSKLIKYKGKLYKEVAIKQDLVDSINAEESANVELKKILNDIKRIGENAINNNKNSQDIQDEPNMLFFYYVLGDIKDYINRL